VARAPPPVHVAFHADVQLLAEPRRALVAELTQKWLERGTHRSTRELVASIRTWIQRWNDEPQPFIWHKTADEILETSPPTATESPTQVTGTPGTATWQNFTRTSRQLCALCSVALARR
jgi:hypothetical protein